MELSNLLIIMILLFAFISLICFKCSEGFESFIQIAHAGGKFNNDLYTNSMEAIQFNYEKGFRYFEVDLYYKDGKVLLLHDEGKLKTNKYKILEFKDLIPFVKKNPSYFLLDIKNEFKLVLETVNKEIIKQQVDPKYFISQVYCIEDIKELYSKLNKTVVIANWKKNPTFDQVKEMVDYCKANNINIFGTSIWSKNTKYYDKAKRFYKYYKKLGIPILIHGDIKSKEQLEQAKNDGYGVFNQTDYY
jgi:glycerophosphoryl diester phosphodiesterase